MQIHELITGSDDWLAFRATHFGASEAAAMLGISKQTTRTELLRLKKLGIGKEFSDWVQANVLDKGHAIEALARPIIEARIGEPLYATTCSEGELSVSTDGLTIVDIPWECKLRNAENFDMVVAGKVPPEHMPQCMQSLMITKAPKLIFTVSDGTEEGTVSVDVLPDPAWFARLRAGWAQFATDLATFKPEAVAEPAPTGRAPDALPALHIVLKGEVSASNLAEFKDVALTAIRSVNRDLKTDQDFADSAKARKWCSDIEDRVKAAKDHALSQTATIDMLFRTMDEVSAEAREVRLALEKLEKARNESLRGEIVAGGIAGLRDHIATLNARFGRPLMPAVPADFAGAIKGKKSFASMTDAVATALANAKIEASAIAEKITANSKSLEARPEHAHLFPDVAMLVLKAPDDLAAVITARIAEAAAAEQRKKDADAARAAATPRAPAPAPAVVQMVAPARAQPASTTVPTLTLGQIGTRLGFSLTADFLSTIGFEPAGRQRAAVLFHEHDWPHICSAISAHVLFVGNERAAA